MDSLERRVHDLERFRDHMEPWKKDVDHWRNALSTAQAVDQERRKHMDKRFDALEERMDRLDGHLTKLVWLIITSIVVAFMTFVIGGGLNALG